MSFKFFTIVKEQSACIVERFGKYHKTLNPGLHFLIPVMDRISYNMSLKEESITVENQQAITKDNVTVLIGGTLFIRIDDPYKASYNIEKPLESVKLLALTVLRSEIGKIKLDKLFKERQELNKAVNQAVNKAANIWGINCLRYEILQIDPPNEIKQSMQYEAEAERLKRREVVISEGKQQSEINISEGKKISQIKSAEGDAESLKLVSTSEAEALKLVGEALERVKKQNSVSYILIQNYLKNYEKTLRKSNLIIAPEGKAQSNGKSSGNNDLITVAAMLMLNSTSQGRKITQNISNGVQAYENQQSMKQLQNTNYVQQNSLSEYPDLIQKMKFYEDPILYSSDDEAKKNQQQQFQSSKQFDDQSSYRDDYNEKQQKMKF
ncbi:hypothetical protein ABPG72_002158 [Tetrahymena utriculariae]